MDLDKVGELLVVLFVGLGGGVGGKWLMDLLKHRQEGAEKAREANRVERKDAISELNDIVVQLRKDLNKTEAKAEQALTNERDCERKWVRAVSYIEYIGFEAQLRGWQIRPWKEHGTDIHLPLYGSSAENRRKADDPNRTGPERRQGGRDRGGGPVEPHGPTTNSAEDDGVNGAEDENDTDDRTNNEDGPPTTPDGEGGG